MQTASYRLYGAEVSYFTGKVRSYLRWKGLAFEEIAADAAVYRNVIVPRVGFPVIPIVIDPEDSVLQDSTEIIDVLERRHPEPSIVPDGAVQRLVASLLELYADEWLVLPAMHYRWHHNRPWAEQEFGRLAAPDQDPQRQRQIGAQLAAPFARAAHRVGAQPHMHAAIEASYKALLAELDIHFEQHDYVLGSRPCIADFGLYGPLYAHQYRDPASGQIMARLAPSVVAWVERMRDAAGPAAGAFVPDDGVPTTLWPVLERMMVEQFPVLVDTADRLRRYIAESPGKPISRGLATQVYRLSTDEGQRVATPYSLWMLQRSRDLYMGLQGAQLAAGDGLLDAIGGDAFRRYVDPPRLARKGMGVALL